MKFLVVDDSKISREKIKNMIIELGYEVVGEAKDGEEAIRLVETLKPTFITMDLEMPNLKGDQASVKILEINPKINIILVTSIVNQKEIINAIRLGVKKFLQKPISIEKLKEVITDIVNMKKIDWSYWQIFLIC